MQTAKQTNQQASKQACMFITQFTYEVHIKMLLSHTHTNTYTHIHTNAHSFDFPSPIFTISLCPGVWVRVHEYAADPY